MTDYTYLLNAKLVDETGGTQFAAALYYNPASDPYAVTLRCEPGHPGEVQWLMARSLLSDGLEGATGEGDVRTHPLSGGAHVPDRLCVQLAGQDGTAALLFDRADIVAFLERTYALVPRDRESLHADLDAEITALLAREPRAQP